MKIRILAILLVFYASFSNAQKYDQKIPDFGKVSKEELQIKECPFDKTAEAYVLFDVEEINCNLFLNSPLSPVKSERERHIRIKILNTKGLDFANIRIRYVSWRNQQEVKNITAQTYNTDASGNISVVKVEKNVIYDKKIDSRISEKVFTFSDVKPGSIIEYKYRIQSDNIMISNWFFQRSIPVQLSRFTVDFPQELEIAALSYCSFEYDRKYSEKGSRTIQKFEMLNIPAFRDEPYISSEDDYLQRIEPEFIAINIAGQRRIPLTNTWPQIIRYLMENEDFGVQLKKEIPRTAELDEQLKRKSTPVDKMATIYYYVRKNMEWNGYDNIWALEGVKTAWKDKKGTSGEINLILVNLLKDAGINAHPILVSTLDNGSVKTGMAKLDQFNKVMAYVELDGKIFVMDATDKYTPYNMIPLPVSYSEGLVIEKPLTFEWGWQILAGKNQIYRDMTSITATLDKDNIIYGNANIINWGYSRTSRMKDLKAGKSKYIEKYFIDPNPGVKIDSMTVENEDKDSMELNHKFDFTLPAATSGDYKYFRLSLFSGFEKNIFSADTRFSDIFFGANQHHILLGTFTIPDDYEFDELPKNIKMIMPDTSITISRILQSTGKVLSSRFVIEFKKPIYEVDIYPAFQEFYKQLFDLLDEQIIIKKKPKP